MVEMCLKSKSKLIEKIKATKLTLENSGFGTFYSLDTLMYRI